MKKEKIKMTDVKKETQVEVEEKACNCENLKAELEQVRAELEQVKKERDQYVMAYNNLSIQNSNLWGIYSNTIDYVVNQTQTQGK